MTNDEFVIFTFDDKLTRSPIRATDEEIFAWLERRSRRQPLARGDTFYIHYF